MRILLLSFYYAPDLSAGSFRATTLVPALAAAAPPGSIVDVVTTAPNRYQTFAPDAPPVEEAAHGRITRVALPRHASGMLDQSRAFLAFARGARDAVRGQRYDVVLATSGRLMTAALGAHLAGLVGAKLYLDLRDIFVDTIHAVLPAGAGWVARQVFPLVERWAVSRAAHVNLVSEGFTDYFTRRYPGRDFTYFTNGVDEEFVAAAPDPARASPPRAPGAPVHVVYAGNIGESQGLHGILPALARALGEAARFTVIGDGGRRAALEAALAEAGVTTVTIRPPVQRAALIAAYREADVLFLHLNDYDVFRTVLPSKIFEYAAMGKPVLAGIAGYSARFTEREIPNAAVFPPCDAEAGVAALRRLVIADTPRPAFLEQFARAAINRRMAEHVVAVAAR